MKQGLGHRVTSLALTSPLSVPSVTCILASPASWGRVSLRKVFKSGSSLGAFGWQSSSPESRALRRPRQGFGLISRALQSSFSGLLSGTCFGSLFAPLHHRGTSSRPMDERKPQGLTLRALPSGLTGCPQHPLAPPEAPDNSTLCTC